MAVPGPGTEAHDSTAKEGVASGTGVGITNRWEDGIGVARFGVVAGVESVTRDGVTSDGVTSAAQGGRRTVGQTGSGSGSGSGSRGHHSSQNWNDGGNEDEDDDDASQSDTSGGGRDAARESMFRKSGSSGTNETLQLHSGGGGGDEFGDGGSPALVPADGRPHEGD